MLNTNTKLLAQICCLYSCWIQILSFWYRYVVYTDVGYKCQVISIHVMAIIPSFLILSAQVCTLWQFSPCFSYCQLRCAHVLSCQAMKRHVKSCHADYPLISHIVSSSVHFVAIFPSFLILLAQVCTCVVLSSHETPCQVMTIHVKSCQIMSWRLSPCFSYCQLRCALQPKQKDKTQNRSSSE